MKINEIKTGMVFTIEETPSYPKLKTNSGYVDMRDEIVNDKCDLTIANKDCRELTITEMAKKFDITEHDVESWMDDMKLRYLK